MISGIFSSIIKFSKLDHSIVQYKTIGAKYSSLEGNIRRQLSLDRIDRINAGKYLEWVSKSYVELVEATPILTDDGKPQEWSEITPKQTHSVIVDIANLENSRYDDGKMKYEMLRLKEGQK
jgi:hypothetical protein